MNSVLDVFAAIADDPDRIVFVHELRAEGVRWHFGDCFPDPDTCVIPIGGDIEATEH